MSELMIWGVFALLVVAMLALDLGVLGGSDKIIGISEDEFPRWTKRVLPQPGDIPESVFA
jgi:hypothetical protein